MESVEVNSNDSLCTSYVRGPPLENKIDEILESREPVRLATGFAFTEGPLWDPQGFFYFADLKGKKLYRITPGAPPEFLRDTLRGNGTTFDLEGRLLQCETDGRRIIRRDHDGSWNVILEAYQGGRLSRPNDIICSSSGDVYFTDPAMRVPYSERKIPTGPVPEDVYEASSVFRLSRDGAMSLVARCEYPNGLAFSPDERTLYVANSRSVKYIHRLELDEKGQLLHRSIFADMSSHETDGGPDGMKVDMLGRVFCTGPGGVWVFEQDGKHIATIKLPEIAFNLAFGGSDMKTLLFTARTSIYTLRVRTPGIPHPWHTIFHHQKGAHNESTFS